MRKEEPIQIETYLILRKGKIWTKPLLAPRTTATKPKLAKDEIAFRLRLTVPPGLFEESIPIIEVNLPATLAIHPPIEAEVIDG